MRDTPFLRVYRIDYVNMARDARSIATRVDPGDRRPGGPGGRAAQNNSTATINSVSANKFWDTLVGEHQGDPAGDRQGDPGGARHRRRLDHAPAQPGGSAAARRRPPRRARRRPRPSATFREAASVIANPETGILNIRATSRQHEKVQEFLDNVMTNARRQVLIEATVAEVQLNNQYQRGIDWQRLRSGAHRDRRAELQPGLERRRVRPVARPARRRASTPTRSSFGGAITSLNFNFALKFLESFGDVRVLSSPKISVLNNQTAVLKVVDNLVYFTIQAQTAASAPDAALAHHLHHHAELGAGRLHHEPGAADQRDRHRGAQPAPDDLAQDRRRRRPQPDASPPPASPA